MKHSYHLLILLAVLTLTTCKRKDVPKRGLDPSDNQETQRTPEEDRRLLESRLAHTEQIWDSLATILRRKDLEEAYRDSIQNLYVRNKRKQDEVFKDFIRENRNSPVSVEELNGFKFRWGRETTEELYQLLGEEMQNSEDGKTVKKYLTYYNSPEINDLYSDFELPDLNGESIQLSENLRSYTLLEFWASWCVGCRKEHPELVKVYEEFQGSDFTVIGISTDTDDEVWKAAVTKDKLPWINLLDPDGREGVVQYQYGIHYLPTNFLIDPAGKIIAKDVKPAELREILQRNLRRI